MLRHPGVADRTGGFEFARFGVLFHHSLDGRDGLLCVEHVVALSKPLGKGLLQAVEDHPLLGRGFLENGKVKRLLGKHRAGAFRSVLVEDVHLLRPCAIVGSKHDEVLPHRLVAAAKFLIASRVDEFVVFRSQHAGVGGEHVKIEHHRVLGQKRSLDGLDTSKTQVAPVRVHGILRVGVGQPEKIHGGLDWVRPRLQPKISKLVDETPQLRARRGLGPILMMLNQMLKVRQTVGPRIFFTVLHHFLGRALRLGQGQVRVVHASGAHALLAALLFIA